LHSQNIRSLRFFTLTSSIWGIVYGLIGPFYAVYVAKLSGGMDKLGYAFSIMISVQAATSYFVGRYSDRLGRKPFLFMTAYMDAAILFAYTVIDKTYQIYILQALLGVTNAVGITIKESLLGDLTRREKRGLEIGKFNALVSLFSAAGLALGGYMTKFYGLKSIFYVSSIMIACSTALLFFIHEPAKE
jgi:DHA1 family multidrug resistance protein-like MFS transporter